MNRAHAWLARWLYVLALCAAALLNACGGAPAPPTSRGVPAPPAAAPAPVAAAPGVAGGAAGTVRHAPPTRAAIGFRSPARLREHFAKHGAEFGRITEADYLRRAQALRDAPVGGPILELRRPDGTISRYDRHSGTFLALDADGTIRTCFRPNAGEAYFKRQANRRPHR